MKSTVRIGILVIIFALFLLNFSTSQMQSCDDECFYAGYTGGSCITPTECPEMLRRYNVQECLDVAEMCCCNCPDNDNDGFTDSYCGGEDCADWDANINPAVAEKCDDLWDNDCDGMFECGDPDCNNKSCNNLQTGCSGKCVDSYCHPDCDGDGYYGTFTTIGEFDCNDWDPSIYPGAAEICNDNIDNNCDGMFDCGDSSCSRQQCYYYPVGGNPINGICCDNVCLQDSDNDGFVMGISTECSNVDNDCNDMDANINPSAAEICNGMDDDCDGIADNGLDYMCEPCLNRPLTDSLDGNEICCAGTDLTNPCKYVDCVYKDTGIAVEAYKDPAAQVPVCNLWGFCSTNQCTCELA